MGLRQREWARRERDRLRELLGGKCALCPATEPLHFDVEVPADDIASVGRHHRQMGWSQRMSFYRRQHAIRNLRLLCGSCNAKKGSGDDKRWWAARRADAAAERMGGGMRLYA